MATDTIIQFLTASSNQEFITWTGILGLMGTSGLLLRKEIRAYSKIRADIAKDITDTSDQHVKQAQNDINITSSKIITQQLSDLSAQIQIKIDEIKKLEEANMRLKATNAFLNDQKKFIKIMLDGISLCTGCLSKHDSILKNIKKILDADYE